MTGRLSYNAFQITPSGEITQIIDATGDGAGAVLSAPHWIAVDHSGNAYISGTSSDNAFKIDLPGFIPALPSTALMLFVALVTLGWVAAVLRNRSRIE